MGQLLSRIWLFATPWTAAHQAPLSMGFFRLEYRSGLPLPPPGELPEPGIEPMSPVSPALQAEPHWAIREADSILYRDTSPVTSIRVKRGVQRFRFPLCEKTQQEDSHQSTKNKIPTRHWVSGTSILNFSASRTVRSHCVLFNTPTWCCALIEAQTN